MNPDFNTMAKIVFIHDYDIKLTLSVGIIMLLLGCVIVISLFNSWIRHKNSKTDSKDVSQHNYKLYE